MIKVKSQLCCYQGQKLAECCYWGQKIACCCYQGQNFFFDFRASCLRKFILHKLTLSSLEPLVNRRVRHALQNCYRHLSFISYKKCEKNVFFLKKINLLEFCQSVVIRVKNQLTVVIREMNPNNNRCRSFSQTADISAITHQFKVVVSPFERGHSKDYANAKIISIE